MKQRRRITAWVLSLLAAVSVLFGGISLAFGAAGNAPAHSKQLTDNEDGTYKLELSVTGEADYNAEPVKANVIIILDTSGSMDFLIPSTTGSYGETTQDGDTRNDSFPLYKRTGSGSSATYEAITDAEAYTGTVYSRSWNYRYNRWEYSEYTGTRYSTTSRMDATKSSVNNLIDTLGSQNTTANPDTIEMSLITFASNGSYNTPNSARATDWVSGDGSSLKSTVSGLDANGGTNWDDALNRANALAAAKANQQPNEKVYIVFFSDGEPTVSNSNNDGDSATSHTHQNNSNNGSGGGNVTDAREYNSAYYHARQIYNASYDSELYGIFAFGTEESYMKNVISYGNYGDASHAGSVEGELYFNANSEEDIEEAFSKIASSIVNAVGITDVSIKDGTTNQVSTSTGKVELLEINEDSYEYWLSWNLSSGTNTFKSFIDGKEVECTAEASGSNVVITWAGGTATYEGTIKGEVVKVKWTGKTDFYDFAPPEAQLNDDTGAVDWDLSDVGTLLNGVTYSVTFDVYPSQTALDYKARLDNGEAYDDVVPAAAQEYMDAAGNLETNTDATLTYSDTRLENPGPKTSEFTNPPAVKTESSSMTVKKEWEGGDPPTVDLKLDILAGGYEANPFYEATLNNAGSWQASFHISCGLIVDGKVLEGAKGHDFTFAELGDEQYHWELHAPTVRPMEIDGAEEPTILIKADPANGYDPTGKTQYTIDGATYYVDPAISTLTATNHRRSNLNLTKVVTGEDAPADATFPFELQVNNPKAPAAAPADDPDHNSDYWLWFSIYDTKVGATVMDAEVSGDGLVGPAADGFYYLPSKNKVTVQMKDGWNLRFTNLPTGTTYSFTEGNLSDGFVFSKAELTAGSDSTFSGDRTTTGKIEKTETSYTVTYTNDYQRTDLEITKVWEDASNQDGLRPSADAFKALLTLSPAVQGAEPTVVDNGDNTYTITYKDLPRYNNGQEVTYTVAEGAIDGYATTGSPAEDHGTITNTHTPEQTSVSVEKVWDDADDQDGKRPDSVQVQLLADGEASGDPKTLDESTEWKATWTNLPKYKDGGTEIEYTVEEVETEVITGTDGEGTYAHEVTGEAPSYTVTNTHTPVTIEIDGTKTWDDEKYDGLDEDVSEYERPTITVTLTGSDGKTYSVELDGTADTAPTGDEAAGYEYEAWKYKFVNLPKFSAGTEVVYTLTEETPDGFVSEVTDYDVVNTPEETKVVEGDEVGVTVKKVDAVTGNVIPTGATFTLTDAEGKETTYTTGADGTAKITFDGYTTDEDVDVAKKSTYTLEETTAPTGYTPSTKTYTITVEEELVSVSLNAGNVWEWLYNLIAKMSGDSSWDAQEHTLTVENPPTTTEVEATKIWEDNGDQDGVRPEDVTFQLYKTVNDQTTAVEGKTATLSGEGDEWTTKFEKLPAYEDGYEVTYTVREMNAAGTAAVDEGGALDDNYTASYGDDGLSVTNSYTPEQTSVSVEKVWEDMDDINEMRPDSVQVQLLADGEASGDPKTLDESTEWKATWTNLPKYKDGGTEIAYTVEENPVPTGYTVSYAGDEGAYIITNTLDLTGPVSANKAWLTVNTDGAESTEAPDGAEVTFTLYADGEATGYSVVLDGTADEAAPTVTGGWESKAWVATFVNLPKTNDETGEDIEYTIVETGTYDGYTCSGSPAANGGTITNTHTDDEKTVTYGDTTTIIDGHVASAGDVLTYTIEYNNNSNETADVTVTDTIPAYTTYNNDASPEATFADGVLTWTIKDVAAGGYGSVTFSVTVNKDANGQKIENDAAVKVGENTSTTNQVTTNIPVKDVKKDGASANGEGVQVGDVLTYEVTFTIDEAVTDAVVKDTVPVGTTYVAGSATGDWATIDDSTGTITWTFVGDEENMLAAGTYTVSFQVTVTEAALQYDEITNTANITVNTDPEVNTNTVKNTPEKGSLAISKTVVNESLAEGETDSTGFPFTVTLYDKNEVELTSSYNYSVTDAEGNEVSKGTVKSGGTITLTDGQTATITGLPAGAIYVVEEAEVANYTADQTSLDGQIAKDETAIARFTNTYQVTSVTANKAWSTNGDTTPPEGAKVTFTLFANGKATGHSIELDGTADDVPDGDGAYESEAWVATFVNVPVSDANGEITYTIVETSTYKGYTCSGSPATNGGTITNSHTDNTKKVVSSKSEVSIDGQLVAAGDVLTYTIDYTNNTNDTATVTVTDTIPAYTTYNGDASPEATFADGVLTWTIADVAAGASGSVTFSVTVSDEANGETIVNDAKVKDGENESSTNAVTTSVPVKEVSDEDGADIDGKGVQVGDTLTYDVTFTITEDADSVIVTDEVPEHTTLVDGTITSGGTYDGTTITWDLGPLTAGTYTVSFDVTVDETAVEVSGITNTAYISVNDNPKVETNEVEVDPEKGNLTITKTVTVPDGFELDADKAFDFTITLTDKKGEALTESYAYTGSYEGTVSGTGSFSLKHGESITIADLPAGAKYTIAETAADGYTTKATNGDGTIANNTTIEAEFVNAYSVDPVAVNFPVQKIVTVPEGLNGPTSWSFNINVAANDGAPEAAAMTGVVTNEADTVTFGDFSFTKPGTYTYTVTESGTITGITNDAEAETGKTVTVVVTDNHDGTMAATADSTDEEPVNFVNPYEPEVGLEVTKTVTSKPANGSYYKAGEKVTYKVVVTNTGEYDLADVKVDDELTGDHWTIATLAAGTSESFDVSYKVTDADVKAGSVLNVVTAEAENPYDPDEPLKDEDDVEVPTGSDQTPPKKKVVPQTGDDTPTGAMAVMTVFGAAALTAGTVLKRKRK